jgi:hypothetical protein
LNAIYKDGQQRIFMTNVICLTFTDLWGVPFPWPWFLKRFTKNLEIMKSPKGVIEKCLYNL